MDCTAAVHNVSSPRAQVNVRVVLARLLVVILQRSENSVTLDYTPAYPGP